ncbi:MAG TPA: hypothetical protein VFD54_03820, partial [Anaerolineales bacterium]|nr:hypothetical protein [Anaerolineales bacterium]
MPGLLALIALACIGRLVLLGSIIRKNIAAPPVTLTVTTAVDVDPSLTVTAGTSEPAADLSEKIVYTCQINRANNSDQICLIHVDRTGQRQLTDGDNAQSPSFSSGGRYIAFTGYTDVDGRDELSCEIFIMDLFSKEKLQLTKNDYCDYQPRWG